MLIFDYEKFVKDIKESGITNTDVNAKMKIRCVMEDMIANTTYSKGKIIEKVKSIAENYFHGLPDDIVEKELELLYDYAKAEDNNAAMKKHEKKIISLYDSEMRTITELKDDKLMRLAFAAMIVHKFLGLHKDTNGIEKCYKSVNLCKSDIYRIAGLTNISGTTKNKLWKVLRDKGLIQYMITTNKTWKYNKRDITKRSFSIPFIVELQTDSHDEQLFKRVTNYDDVMLYLRYWLKADDFITCADCGCPIERKGNARKYCFDCADERKKISDRERYNRHIISA